MFMSVQSEKVMLVTGANAGMGLATTIALAKTGATVIMLCRDADRGAQALRQARQQAGHDHIFLTLADLADMATISQFSEKFHMQYKRLDVLVNNAGVIVPDRRETAQGLEMQFGVNHMGHFLLTRLLSDLLLATPGARVVVVSSGAHKVGRINFDDINLTRHYGVAKAYAQSKLANILFARELSRRWDRQDVAVNCCHPGAVATEMGVDRETGYGRSTTRLLKPFFQTPEKGAATAISLALTALGEKNEGAYFYKKHHARVSRRAADPELAACFWQFSEQLLEKVYLKKQS